MKMPKIIDDLFSDLRDKRLLPVVGVLVLALFAIPLLLSSDGPDPSATSGVASDELSPGVAEAPEAQAVVLAEVPGIRNYKERLESFNKKNPFRQQLTQPPKAVQRALKKAEQEASGGLQVTEPSGGSAPAPEPADVSGDSGSSSGSGQKSSSGSGGKNKSKGGNGTRKIVLFSWEITAKMGPIGEAKKYDDVKMGSFLPGDKRPIVQFLGASSDNKRAVFYVSRDVRAEKGDGRCLPNRANCEYLELKPGDQRRLYYEVEDKPYRLKLSKLDLVEEVVDRSELKERGMQASTSLASTKNRARD